MVKQLQPEDIATTACRCDMRVIQAVFAVSILTLSTNLNEPASARDFGSAAANSAQSGRSPSFVGNQGVSGHGASDGLRRNSELSSVTLQSVVSKRASQLQLTKGMMNLNENTKSVAKNIYPTC